MKRKLLQQEPKTAPLHDGKRKKLSIQAGLVALALLCSTYILPLPAMALDDSSEASTPPVSASEKVSSETTTDTGTESSTASSTESATTEPSTEPSSEPAEESSAPADLSEGAKVTLNDTLQFAHGDVTFDVKISGTATVTASQESAVADSNAKSATSGNLKLTAAALGNDQPAYQAAADYAQKTKGEGKLLSVSALDFDFYYQNRPLNVSGCTITAKITPQAKLQQQANQVDSSVKDIAPEADVGVELTALKTNGSGDAEKLADVLIEKNGKTTPSMTVTLDSSDPQVQVLAQETANPRFTVQYYAYLPRVQYGDNGQLTIINTDKGGSGNGGNLPKNGVTPDTMNLELTQTGQAGVYGVTTENQLEEVYADHEFEYVSAPNLTYFNRLYENGNYSLTKVWVLKDGRPATSTNASDWDIYDAESVHFTNRQASVENPDKNDDDSVTLLITDDTVIRLVFDTTLATYNNAASFYDYDITEDGWYTYKDGHAQGINNPSNYTGPGAKLAFGNANTGTGLETEEWNGNQLNQYNRSGGGYEGCTFGLATGLDTKGHIQYADDVSVPNLFNDGSAIGKTSYDNGEYSLNFNRVGDTYTLTSVEGAGTSADKLQYFNHPESGTTTYNNIWTNNFWPMDGKSGTDGLTGAFNDRGNYVGKDGNNMYPPSDDGVAHNNLFGMTYTVNFNLVEDYSGPLEYLFFGDDDMWVFLTDPNSNSQLVCDIGGVHSTVGEYVNLWDYIARKTDSETGAKTVTNPGNYKLTFFYTERGLSGSSCYMQFTLPSVSSVTPEQNTSQLKVQKVVTGGTEAQNNADEFNFTINLTDASDHHLLDDYAYTRYKEDGTVIATDLITFDGGTFSLKNGEYIIIKYLPYGTQYTISEDGTGDPNVSLDGKYTVSGTVNASGSSESVPFTGVTATGQIQNGQNGEVVYTNKLNPKLPDTGGTGTMFYTLGGVAILACGLVFGIRRRRMAS